MYSVYNTHTLSLSRSHALSTSLSITTKIFNFGSGPHKYIGFVFYCHIHSKHELIQNMKRNERKRNSNGKLYLSIENHMKIFQWGHMFLLIFTFILGEWSTFMRSHWSVVLVPILVVIQTRVSSTALAYLCLTLNRNLKKKSTLKLLIEIHVTAIHTHTHIRTSVHVQFHPLQCICSFYV